MNVRFVGAVAAVALASAVSAGLSFASALVNNTPEPMPRESLQPNRYTVGPEQLPGGGWREAGSPYPPSCALPDPALGEVPEDYHGRGMQTSQRQPGEVAHSWYSSSYNNRRADRWYARTLADFRRCAGPGASETVVDEALPGGARGTVVRATVACAAGDPCAPHRLFAVVTRGSVVSALELHTDGPVDRAAVVSSLRPAVESNNERTFG